MATFHFRYFENLLLFFSGILYISDPAFIKRCFPGNNIELETSVRMKVLTKLR